MKDLVIVGAGGHARIVLNIFLKNNEYNIIEIIDTYKKYENEKINGIEIKKVDTIKKYLETKKEKYIFLAIGDNIKRKTIYQDLKSYNFKFANCIHSSALIETNVNIGENTFIGAGSILGADVEIKDNVIINNGVIICHETVVGKHSHIAPGTNIAGRVSIGEKTFVGIGSDIVDKLKIGNNVTIGAGSVVLNDIDNNKKVAGVPARIID